MLDTNEVFWRIVPKNTPLIIRHCSKCNKKMEYYCSEKFRMNGNHTKIDIWLIYKCSKCDTTLKLTIAKGIKPRDISSELFDRFTHNDAKLAWQYAFDRNFLKQNACVVQYTGVTYNIEGFEREAFKTEHLQMPPSARTEPYDPDKSMIIHLKSAHYFDLKLGAFLSGVMGISVSKLKHIVNDGLITVTPACDIIKHKIKSDIDIHIQPLN